MLPGATAVLFTVGTGDIVTWNDATIEVLDLESRERKALIEGGTSARYVDTGHIVYGRANQLLAVPFDLDTLEVTGSPVPVLDGVQLTTGAGSAEFNVTSGGALLYAQQHAPSGQEIRWVRRDGTIEATLEHQLGLYAAVPSPDGRFLAMWVEEANGTILLYDRERESSTRLVTGLQLAISIPGASPR